MVVKNPVIVVTGGSSGIGKAISVSLAASYPGAVIVIIARDQAKLKSAQERIRKAGTDCMFYAGDLSSQTFIRKVFVNIKKKLKRLDFLVNNAGSHWLSHDLLQTTPKEWKRSMALNLDAVFFCSKLAAGIMVEGRITGSIVNISSIAGQIGTSRTSYSAAKAGIIGLTRSTARTLAPFGIRVNAVAPGAVDTPATRHWTDLQRRDICNHIPLGRIGTPAEIAEVVAFLLSEKASYITGQTLNVNGGWQTE